MTDYSRPSMKEDDHPEHNMPESEHDGTEYQVNVGSKTNKGGAGVDPYPNTDDNTFLASGSDARMIRAKRQLRDGLNSR